MMKVIGDQRSRAFRVLWMLEELGLPYEHVPASPQTEGVLRHNPTGKIPVLLVDGNAIADSTAILSYLTDVHGKFTHPAGTLERARQDSFTNLVLDEFDACVWMAARHSFVLPEEHRMGAIKASLRWEFRRSAAKLAARMQPGRYLAGSELTVPDFILAHCLYWARLAKFEHSEAALDSFLEQMSTRPAYLRVIGGRT